MTDPDGLDELGRELRRRVGRETREEAEERERDAARLLARTRTLADVAADLRARGDQVTVEAEGRRFTGVVVYAGRDYLRLRAPAGDADVRLDAIVAMSVDRPGEGGHGPVPGAEKFRARLLESEGAEVEVGRGHAEPLRGRLETVGQDHLLLRDADGRARWVASSRVAYVLRQRP